MQQLSNPRQTKSKGGSAQITVAVEGLPQFLIDANTATATGNIEQAKALLTDQAIEEVEKIVNENPFRTDIAFLLAIVFDRVGQIEKAEEWYEKILEIDSNPNPLVYRELGRIARLRGNYSQATEFRRKALNAEPDNVEFWISLAMDLMREGKIHEGIDLFRKAVDAEPDNVDARSKLLWHLHYLPDQSPQLLYEEYKKLGQIAAPSHLAKKSHDNDPDPNRRLRIGYISPDFRMQSAAFNFDSFLTGRNKDAVEVYGYGNVAVPDKFTEHFKNSMDCYRNIRGMDDKNVAELIKQDKIDILVEIGGYVSDNRLSVLAYKPAPIQVDYGGINTTGISQIDYRLTDIILDPPHLYKYYVEESICLPTGLFCYRPSPFAPPVASLPAIKNGYITFASFNNNLKMSPYIMEIWANVLKAVNNSRLVLKFGAAADKNVKQRYYNMFEKLQISADKIDIHGWVSPSEHMNMYNTADIMLDTYPYNGTITTLEGLWMGVPIITLVGENSLLSRAGLSILSRLDMQFFAAATPNEYVKKAAALAGNLDALAKIRDTMRQRMTNSTLCNPKIFASAVETAYRKMWHKWCRSQGVDVSGAEAESDTELAETV